MMYSKKVLDLFKNPKNVGKMKDYDGMGQVGNPRCGDIMHLYIKVKDNIITDISFETFGCIAAITSSSVITEMVRGKTIEEALKITKDDVMRELDGLPPIKIHCSILALDALEEAINDYKNKQ